MKICKNCGTENLDNNYYCTKCGVPLQNNSNSTYNPPNNTYQNFAQTTDKPVKKKNKGCLTACIVVIAIPVILALMIIAGNSTTTTTSTSSKYNYDTNNATTSSSSVKTTIERKLLYDKNKVKIYVEGLENNNVNFYFVNNSSTNLRFESEQVAINGIIDGDLFNEAIECKVLSKSKANASLEIDSSFINKYGIDKIKTIDVCFTAYDNDTLGAVEFYTEQIQIKTNINEDVYRIVGEKIYDNKNIRIDYIGRNDNQFEFMKTNETGNVIGECLTEVKVNGYTFEDRYLYNTQLNNSQKSFYITVDDEFLENNSIDSIDTITFKFDIYNNANDDELYGSDWTTKEIKLEVKNENKYRQ